MERLREAQRRLLTLSRTVESDEQEPETIVVLRELLFKMASEININEDMFRLSFGHALATSVGWAKTTDKPFMNFLAEMFYIRDALLSTGEMDIPGAFNEVEILNKTLKDYLVFNHTHATRLIQTRLQILLGMERREDKQLALAFDLVGLIAGRLAAEEPSQINSFIFEEMCRIRKAYNLW